MSAPPSVDDIEMSMKWDTPMRPYLFRVNPVRSWNGQEVSVILPVGTLYSLGAHIVENGQMRQDFSEGPNGFIVPPVTGKVMIMLRAQARMKVGNEVVPIRTMQIAQVTLSLLPKSMSKKDFFNQLKKKEVQVLAEGYNSLFTRAKAANGAGEIFEKTLIQRNLVVRIKVTTEGDSSDLLLYQLFNKIRLTPQSLIDVLAHK